MARSSGVAMKPVVFFCRNLRNSPMSVDLVELDLAARALCQSLDLTSGGRKRVLDRDLDVHVASVTGRLVADHDVPVGRNRHPNVDTIEHEAVALLSKDLASKLR